MSLEEVTNPRGEWSVHNNHRSPTRLTNAPAAPPGRLKGWRRRQPQRQQHARNDDVVAASAAAAASSSHTGGGSAEVDAAIRARRAARRAYRAPVPTFLHAARLAVVVVPACAVLAAFVGRIGAAVAALGTMAVFTTDLAGSREA